MNVESMGHPPRGDVRDALRRGSSMLRALAELIDAIEQLGDAVESVALELEHKEAGDASILAQRQRADDAERQGGAP